MRCKNCLPLCPVVSGVACFKASAKHIGHGFPLPTKQALYFPEPADAGDFRFVEVTRHGLLRLVSLDRKRNSGMVSRCHSGENLSGLLEGDLRQGAIDQGVDLLTGHPRKQLDRLLNLDLGHSHTSVALLGRLGAGLILRPNNVVLE